MVKSRQRKSQKQIQDGGVCPDVVEKVPKKRKNKSQASFAGGAPAPVELSGPIPAMQQQQQQQQQQQKPVDRMDYAIVAEQLIHQMQQLPSINLKEPEVKINYAVWPMLGTSLFSGMFHGMCQTSQFSSFQLFSNPPNQPTGWII